MTTPAALMFHVKDGGVSDLVKWDKNNLQPDRSIIILDESSTSLFLWHGTKQGLVQRRTALRQAQSLKGHGYTVGRSIIGRDTKIIIEIDARKVGRDPETTKMNEQLEEILNRDFKILDDLIITFSMEGEVPESIGRIKAKPTPKPAATPAAKPKPKVIAKPQPKPRAVVEPSKPSTTAKSIPFASEYGESAAPAKTTSQSGTTDQRIEARIGVLISSILSRYDDIWISKKQDGSYSVEMMDGPICAFSTEQNTIKFGQNSFSGIPSNIKDEIKLKYASLAKLL